jgi:hypothetical protein
MKKPELLYTTDKGGTVHTYQLTGGKSEFNRYLSCYLGSCQFNNDLDGAAKHLDLVEPRA